MPASLLLFLHLALVGGFGLRILLREDLAPDARMAWIVVLMVLPYVGGVLYFLLGEVHIGRNIARRHRQALASIQAQLIDEAEIRRVMGTPEQVDALIAPPFRGAFRYAGSINGFAPMPGNRAELMPDGATARARMIADMEAARHEIHVLSYIWLDDDTGTAVAEALIRAARRGVTCRAMVDGLGSRLLLRTPLWRAMGEAGVHTAVALSIDHPLHVLLTSRIDLRNHRKITVIDGRITYCGSQNLADEAFRIKARYAPWVDIMLRMEGPVVTQNQLLFASDWMPATGEGIARFVRPQEPLPQGFAAQVVADGPTERSRATPQLVVTLIAAAQRQLTITTPYFVPDATVLEALCAAAWRGVQVTLVLPQRNDSRVVAAASRSTYVRLLDAGVAIHEYIGGLLHAKTLTVDGEITLIGSTNLDLRSFDLNYENNVLLQDAALTQAIMARQHSYMAQSDRVLLTHVQQWPWYLRIWNHLLSTMGPVL